MKSSGPPCPHCERPLSVRAQAKIERKAKKSQLGPNRAAALAEARAQDGFCTVCDHPIPHSGPGRVGVYTCGRSACFDEWARLCRMDRRENLKKASNG